MTARARETLPLRPPTPSHIADVSWASLSPTIRPRPVVFPVLIDGPPDGVHHHDPYVREFWVAAIGAAAVTDLLRLAAAARRGAGILRPVNLALLVSEEIVVWENSALHVPSPLPRLGAVQRARLRRGRHRRLLT